MAGGVWIAHLYDVAGDVDHRREGSIKTLPLLGELLFNHSGGGDVFGETENLGDPTLPISGERHITTAEPAPLAIRMLHPILDLQLCDIVVHGEPCVVLSDVLGVLGVQDVFEQGRAERAD